MLVLTLGATVAFAGLIIVGALCWAWLHDTLHETAQERYDRKFDEIVRHLETPGAPDSEESPR
ncbi:MAG: hypothetical protein ACE5MI_13070 [Acidimicrobiia bacterium]